MRPAVFLDRDDTLIENRSVTANTAHPGDLADPALVLLMPGVAEGCRRLHAAGFALVVVSNQACIARGVATIAQVEAVNARMRDLLRASGIDLDAIYYCPHHPKGIVPPYNVEHEWRKPAPGMLLAAAKKLDLDLPRSWLIGDSNRDLEAAAAAGIARERTILLGPTDAPTFAHAAARILHPG